MRKRGNGTFTHWLTRRMVKVCEKKDSASCRVMSMGFSMINNGFSSPPRWSSCGGRGDLANSRRILVKLGSMKNDAFSLLEMPSWTMRTRLANDGLWSKNFFTFFSCLDAFLPLPNMSSRKIYLWQDCVNARSARDKFLRFLSAKGSFASCSMMETSRSSERRESGGFSMFKGEEKLAVLYKSPSADCQKSHVTKKSGPESLY